MKHVFKFTHIVAVVIAAVSMFGFSSCNDEYADYANTTNGVKQDLQEEIKTLEDSVNALEDRVNTYVAIIQQNNDSINKALQQIDSLGNIISTFTPCKCNYDSLKNVVDYINLTVQSHWDSTTIKTYVDGQILDWVLISTFRSTIDSVRNEIDSLEARINTHLKDHCDSLQLSFTETYRIRDSINTVIAGLNGAILAAQTTANTALANAATALTTATNAQTTANAAQADATQALLDAASALLAANTAQATADSAKTIATKAQTDASQALINAATALANAATAQTTATAALDSAAAVRTAVNAAMALATAANTQALANLASINTINTNLSNLTNTVNDLSNHLNTVRDSMVYALTLAKQDSMRIDALQTAYDNLRLSDSINLALIRDTLQNFALKSEVNAVKAHADSINSRLKNYVDSLNTAVTARLDGLDARVKTLEDAQHVVDSTLKAHTDSLTAIRNDLNALTTQVNKNTADIAALTTRLENLENLVNDVFKKTIFGVVLQGTYNPVFGYYALPNGVQNNALVAYYGQNEHVTYFPTESTSDLVYDQYALTSADAAMLGGTVDSWSIPGQTTLLSEGANAGRLYLTINPSNADLSEAQFTLVNSLDEEAGIKLDTLKPCTEKLTFGYTGPVKNAPAYGHANNGLYVAPATLDQAGIPIAKIQIDDRLKTAVKDFYNNHFRNKTGRQALTSLADPSSFAELAQGLYHQFDGLMPRYAVKATWTDSLGTHNVYSDYGVGAVAVKPLSYAFFKDRSLPNLPKISPISALDSFKINMSEIKFNISFHIDSAQANIKLAAITINLDTVDVVVEVPDLNIYQTTGAIVYVKDTVDLDELNQYFNDRFGVTIDKWNDNINNEINQQVNSLINSINKQVNDFATDIQGQLNTNIQKVVDDAAGQVMNKLGSAVDKVNNVISKVNGLIARVNRLLTNPNRLLQTILVYEGKDRQFHIMSTRKSIPTVFTGTGAIMLHPTSCNAEIAAPAYKKFIAVTNVFKGNTSAQDGDAACLAALNAANGQDNFNEVIEGGRISVAFVPTPGFTYEIFYAGLDYSGMISQRKYYVTVK